MGFTSCKTLKINDIEDRGELAYPEVVLLKYRNAERPEHLLIPNASLKVVDENSTTIRLTIYNKKDEFVFVSGRLLGFEIFRFKLTNDSVKFINRAQRNYYFGAKKDINNGMLRTLRLNDIQNLMYSGFLMDDNSNRSYVERNFTPKVNEITYTEFLEQGVKIEMEYDLAAFLNTILFSNHPDAMYLDMNLHREDGELNEITGSYYRNNYEIKFEFDANHIEQKSYSNVQFNLGQNYNEIRNIL